MSAPRPKSSIFQFIVIFLAVYLLTQYTMKAIFPEQFNGEPPVSSVILRPVDKTVKGGHHPKLTIDNYTDKAYVVENRCPNSPVDIVRLDSAGVEDMKVRTPLIATETALPCPEYEPVEPGGRLELDLAPWKYSLFSEYAHYEASLPTLSGAVVATEDDQPLDIAKFEIYEAGTITQIFRTFVSKPLLNALIFIASVLPGHNLGFAIILLTLVVKLILFVPTQHALEGQKKMQEVQPKIEALRKKYKDDPKRLNEETLKLWKTEKINPLQSCLPMLLQFPVLIGLFFVVRDGSYLEISRHLIYSVYSDLSWQWGTNFFGFNLLEPSVYVMPPLLMIMQFLQMKLSFAIAKKKKDAKEDDGKKDKEKKKDDAMASAQETQQKVMMYGLPLMIGFFAIQFPMAVSLYWAVSTLFAIGQQLVVNRKHLT